ncbi:MAG: hypothetical protein E7627_00395 [Ruminococcaceae bacterium]|nr:hypothetical protein [Oscillospiraceae bacterium]
MLTPGLISVTFRKFEKAKVAEIAKAAGLYEIEWGGDVHVPPMDEVSINEAVAASSANGIKIASYGSYYRCTGSEDEIRREIETTAKLGTDMIRVWAGKQWSCDATKDERKATTDNLRLVCDVAKPYGITVCPEFHGNTLTDHYDSAIRLYNEVERDNLKLYWQPNQFKDEEYNLASCRAIMPYCTHIHVFHWEGKDMYPLSRGENIWRKYIDIIKKDGKDHSLHMEFVCDGSEEQLYRDAELLHTWLEK